MTDLSGLLHGVEGDGVHWTLESAGELNVNLVHLDAGHAIDEHVNDAVDVVIVGLAGTGQLTIDGGTAVLAAHVVAHVPRGSRRRVRGGERGLDYLSIHRRPRPLGIRPGRDAEVAAIGVSPDEGGDPACWAHLLDDADDADDGADRAP